MIAFLADAAVAIGIFAFIGFCALVGLIAVQVENRIPYDDGRRDRWTR